MTPEDISGIVEIVKTLNESTAVKPNEWLPIYAALGGAITGAIASIFPTWLIERRRERQFSKQIEKCLLAEISALVKIIEQRKYVDALQDAVNHLKLNPDTTYTLASDIPEHYSRVYQENCKHLGSVESNIACDIIVFYQLIDAVVQDIKPNGTFSFNPPLVAYEEALNMFKEAIDIAQKLQKTT